MADWFTSFFGLYLGTTLFLVLMIICIILPLLLAVAYLTYAERKVLAAIQLQSETEAMLLSYGCTAAWRDAISEYGVDDAVYERSLVIPEFPSVHGHRNSSSG